MRTWTLVAISLGWRAWLRCCRPAAAKQHRFYGCDGELRNQANWLGRPFYIGLPKHMRCLDSSQRTGSARTPLAEHPKLCFT